MKEFKEISISEVSDAIDLIGKEWMLVTAGSGTDVNTMTASWGGLGWLWNKPVAFVFIRPERYTHDFIEREERMTLSFFPHEMKPALTLCGTKSGRDCDKIAEAGLTPAILESGAVSFAEARLTLDCRKLFKAEMTEASFLDKAIYEQWYKGSHGGGLHTVYVVEIEEVYVG